MPDEKKKEMKEENADTACAPGGGLVVDGIAEPNPVVQEQKLPEKRDVSFYLLKARKFRILTVLKGNRIEIKGENSIITIPCDDKFYDFKVKYLRDHRKNRKNGGTEFVELSAEDKIPGGECLLDSLIDLGKESLWNVLSDKEPKHRALSRGSLIMLILKEKGAL